MRTLFALTKELFMKKYFEALGLIFLFFGTNAALAEDKIVYSEKTIDFYVNSSDQQHSDSLIYGFTSGVPDRVELLLGRFSDGNPFFEEPTFVDIGEKKQQSLNNLVLDLLKKTPTAANFSEQVIQSGANSWVKSVLGKSLRSFDNDGSVSTTSMNEALLSEWQQALQMPTRFSFRLGVHTMSVENLVNLNSGEGGDPIYSCLSGTYHKIFLEIVEAETIQGQKFNRIESSKTRIFYSTTIKEERNLFLGSQKYFTPPANSTSNEIQAICNDLM
jgi:flagellar motor switch/type III secretory pathway protein FliN